MKPEALRKFGTNSVRKSGSDTNIKRLERRRVAWICASRRAKETPPKVKIGELVVLVEDVDGIEAGREGCIMGARGDLLTVGCHSRDRLRLVLARTWQVLPRELFRRLSAREGGSK